MTLSALIQMVDEIKPNAFSENVKVAWLNECEGMVQTEVFLWATEEILVYDWERDKDTVLLVEPPHDKLYWTYLSAMIDFANGEYNKYQNTMQLFNTYFGEFMRWFARSFRPADVPGDGGEHTETDEWFRGYYITAYGLAVKQGFSGTLDEWLESLVGAPGEKIELRYNEETDMLQWKVESAAEWSDLISISALEDDAVKKATAEAQASAAAAAVAQTAAEDAKSGAEGAKEEAATLSAGVRTDAENAASAASAASESARFAESGAAAATEANTQAQAARDAAEAAEESAQEHVRATGENATEAGESAAEAAGSADLSKSWAVGGTGVRDGEDTNNAKYWSEQAKSAAGGDFVSREDARKMIADAVEGHDAAEDAHADLFVAKSGKAEAFTVTLSAAGWQENTQAVTDARFATSGYAYLVEPASGSYTEYSEAMVYADNVTAEGTMTFHCMEAPSSDLTVNILRMEAAA